MHVDALLVHSTSFKIDGHLFELYFWSNSNLFQCALLVQIRNSTGPSAHSKIFELDQKQNSNTRREIQWTKSALTWIFWSKMSSCTYSSYFNPCPLYVQNRSLSLNLVEKSKNKLIISLLSPFQYKYESCISCLQCDCSKNKIM